MNDESVEIRFVRVYRELTGAGEGLARSVFMFACLAEDSAAMGGRDDESPPVAMNHQWELEDDYERFTESRSLSHFHQLPGATRERFA